MSGSVQKHMKSVGFLVGTGLVGKLSRRSGIGDRGSSSKGGTIMQRHVTAKALAAVAILILGGTFFLSACAQAPQTSTGAPSAGNAVVRVVMDEWNFKPSIAAVPAGYVTFEAVNQGEDDHEVVILKTDKAANTLVVRSNATKVDETKVDEAASGEAVGEVEVEAGVTQAGTFKLAPGHYVLICNVTKHYKQGMSANLEVTGTAPAAQTAPKPSASQPTTAPAAPGARKDITLFKAVRPYLVKTLDAAQKGDMAAASKAQHEYDIEWHGVEVYLNFRSTKLYGELETDIQARLIKLLDDPKSSQADVVATAKQLLDKYDEAIKLMETSPAISPLFDDLEAIRMLKAETINEIAPLLKAGDVATAKGLFTAFMSRWPDVEDLIKAYSVDAYADTEAAMAKANTAFQKTKPDAAELTPLVADTLARYNFGQSLINAAARNTDLTKTAYTPQDVQLAAGVGAIQAALQASLTSWKAGKYQDAGDQARRASGVLFDSVSGPLKAKSTTEAPLKKALDAYTAVSDKAGDATAVSAAQKAAVEAAAVAQQALVGQFWTDSKFKDALRQAASTK